jgi:thioredoxin-related protein
MKGLPRNLIILSFGAIATVTAWAQSNSAGNFPPLQQWKAEVLSGNAAALKASYSANPEAKIDTDNGPSDVASDVAFWAGLKAKQVKIDIVQSNSTGAGLRELILQMEIHSSAAASARYVAEAQLWQKQGEQWRLAAVKRTGLTRLQQPISLDKQIYQEGVNARAEIKEALDVAAKSDKNVIIVFGANWCLDCHVLDIAFHRTDFVPLLKRNYEVVHVDIGRGDKNQDLMAEYQVPMKKGIPALAVLDSSGKLLTSQKNGEFENARAMAPEELLKFLNRWKPSTQAR